MVEEHLTSRFFSPKFIICNLSFQEVSMGEKKLYKKESKKPPQKSIKEKRREKKEKHKQQSNVPNA
jgi:hypothetical protein